MTDIHTSVKCDIWTSRAAVASKKMMKKLGPFHTVGGRNLLLSSSICTSDKALLILKQRFVAQIENLK